MPLKPNEPNLLRDLMLYYDKRFNEQTYQELSKSNRYNRAIVTLWRIYQKCHQQYSNLNKKQVLDLIKKEQKRIEKEVK